jgi:N-hydroxyarylamine O-acetyltransferase
MTLDRGPVRPPALPGAVAFDLAGYLARVGVEAAGPPDVGTLVRLHRAHVSAIPFENLEIQLGGQIALDLDTLTAKMVRRRRGGYCFEQNALLAAALEAIGFAPTRCEARVRPPDGAILPRTHMVLLVRCEGRDWLVDGGFGADGLCEPLGIDGEPATQAGRTYRVAPEGRLKILQVASETGWRDLYGVLPDPVYPIDYVVGNWFTSTYPASPFVQSLTAQRIVNGTRHTLRNLTYAIARGWATDIRDIARGDLVPLLRDAFGLDVPEDARFRALDG